MNATPAGAAANRCCTLAIRTNNVKAVQAYVTNVLAYAPPAERERLLLARCDTERGRETGDAAFFRLLHSGSIEMIEGFMATILASEELTLEQKWHILDARRLSDNVSAFTMLMGLGDWPRVQAFVGILTGWNMDDFHDLKNPENPAVLDIPGVGKIVGKSYQFRVTLLKGWRRERQHSGPLKTAYAQAMETATGSAQESSSRCCAGSRNISRSSGLRSWLTIRPKNPVPTIN